MNQERTWRSESKEIAQANATVFLPLETTSVYPTSMPRVNFHDQVQVVYLAFRGLSWQQQRIKHTRHISRAKNRTVSGDQTWL